VRDTYTNLRLEMGTLQPVQNDQSLPVKGLVLAKVSPGGEWQYGDRLRLTGKLETPPEEEAFSYREYLARQGVYSTITPTEVSLIAAHQGNPAWAALYKLKHYALGTVYRIFPDPEASLMAGILLGVESGIPAEVQAAFQATGTSHVIAISGFNIAILAGLFTLLFSRLLGRWRGAVVAALGIAFYTLLVGAAASVVRTAIMGWISILAAQMGRRQNGLNSLAAVAAIMAVFNPFLLWDVGFQLSFLATLGLILYADPIQGAFDRLAGRLSTPVGEYLLLTLAAQILVIPVMAYHFQTLSLTMLIANPLVLPVQPAVMILGGLATLAGMIWQPSGQLLAYLAWPFIAYTIRVVEGLSRIP
jgi:competence protein ComEC